jgi:hypothetical protein
MKIQIGSTKFLNRYDTEENDNWKTIATTLEELIDFLNDVDDDYTFDLFKHWFRIIY